MDAGILKTVGQVAGIGGIALGVFLLLFPNIIRKNIFPKLPSAEACRLLRLTTEAIWSIAIVGIVAWVHVEIQKPTTSGSAVTAPGGIAAGRDAIGNKVANGGPSP